MSHDRFDVYFSGKILADRPEAAVREAVGRLFKADAAQLDTLFSGRPVRIRRDVDAETAGQYRASVRAAGALVDIRPAETAAAPAATPSAAQDSPPAGGVEVSEDGPDFDLLPPRSGTLEDFAPPPPPPPDVDLTAMSLAATGAVIDDSPPTPPSDIPTDHLSALPPNQGTLEDCVVAKPGRAVPDVSHLHIDQE